MFEQNIRSALLFGREAMEKIESARVAVFGVGGVGGFAVEALARTGVGAIDLFDRDTVSMSNLNRQIIATRDTIGKYKVDVMKERILSINPEIKVEANRVFYLPGETSVEFKSYDYIIDAIDTITAKIDIIVKAKSMNVPVISAMGAGNKLEPTQLEVADIYETSVCPLARVMRKELKDRGIANLKVVYSKEKARTPLLEVLSMEEQEEEKGKRKRTQGSNSFVPSVAGMILAGEVLKDLAKLE